MAWFGLNQINRPTHPISYVLHGSNYCVCRWVHHVFTMVDGVRTEDELSSVSTSAVVLHQCAPMTSDQCGQKPPLLRLPKHTSPAPPLPHLVLLLLFPLRFPILSSSSSSSSSSPSCPSHHRHHSSLKVHPPKLPTFVAILDFSISPIEISSTFLAFMELV